MKKIILLISFAVLNFAANDKNKSLNPEACIKCHSYHNKKRNKKIDHQIMCIKCHNYHNASIFDEKNKKDFYLKMNW